MALPTLTDVAKFSPLVRTEMIDQAAKACPEFTVLPWKKVPGYTYLTLKRTANPTVAFRDVNEGAAATKSTYTNVTVTCAILNPNIQVDKALANACVDGADVFLAQEIQAHLNASVYTACRQLWDGADAKGFAGLASQVDSTMVVDAGGTTASTGSSVYIVGADTTDNLTWVLGGDGVFEISDPIVQQVTDGTNPYMAYVSSMEAWVGSQLGNSYAVARIRDLTADSGKGLTDTLIYDALATFPTGVTPTAIFMNRRSLKQLRGSRTATNQTGAPATIPTEVEGIPIYVTDAILSTEALS